MNDKDKRKQHQRKHDQPHKHHCYGCDMPIMHVRLSKLMQDIVILVYLVEINIDLTMHEI